MAEDVDARRREFTRRAPEMRTALVAELSDLLARVEALSSDEVCVLSHLLRHAGFSLGGRLYVPALSVLWGEEESYVPAVRLPPGRVRAAALALSRRGILGAAGQDEGVVVLQEALRALARAAPAPGRVILRVAASVDGYVSPRGAFEVPDDEGEPVPLGSGDPAKRLAKLLKATGGDVVIEGDARTAHALLGKDLVDVLVVSTVPVLLGAGVPLFKRGRRERSLKLVSSRAFPSGLVRSRYERG